MSEEQTKTEETPTTPDRGDNEENLTKVERAELAVKRMEVLGAKIKEDIAKLEELRADRILGGETSGPKVEKKEEVDPREYSEKALKGRL